MLENACSLLLLQFLAITSRKLVPAIWILVEPAPQRIARREHLEPFAELKVLFANPTRPQTLDKHALAIA